MADFPQLRDFERVARLAALLDQKQLTRLAAETPGTDVQALLAGAAAVGDAVMGQSIYGMSTFFPTAAKGERLDWRMLDFIGLGRKPASVAMCSVDWSTTNATAAAFPIPHDTRIQTSDGAVWLTTHDATFPKGSVGPLTVRVRSALAGGDQYALANTINQIVDKPVGSPDDLVVNNTKASTIGSDEQDDNSYRTDGQRFFSAARRGTLTAIETRAKRVPGVVEAVATEVFDTFGRPAKIVLLGITDKFTSLYIDQTVIPPAYAVRSQVLAQKVYEELADTRGAGCPVMVELAAVVIQPFTLNLAFAAGSDINQVAYNARVVIQNNVNLLKRGESLSMLALSKVLRNVRGLSYTGNEIAFPIGNVIAKPLQVIRTDLSLINANSLEPDRPLTKSVNADAFV